MIAVTGVEFVCPRGEGVASFCEGSLLATDMPRDLATYNLGLRLPARNLKFVSAASRLFCSTAMAALDRCEASPLLSGEPHRVGIYHGTENSQLEDVFRFDICTKVEGPESVSPMDAPNTLANVAAGELALHLGVTGPTVTVTCGAAGASQAVQLGAWQLQAGVIDMAIVGSVEISSAYHRAMWRPSESRGNIARAPELGVAFILERATAAAARGATMRALLLGGAPACVGSANDDAAATVADAVITAAQDAGISLQEIDLVIVGGGVVIDAGRIAEYVRQTGQTLSADCTALDRYTGLTEAAAGALGITACIGLFQGDLTPEHIGVQACGAQSRRSRRPRIIAVCVLDESRVSSCLLLGHPGEAA